MRRLEIIHVRQVGGAAEALAAELRDALDDGTGSRGVRVFRRARLSLDVSVHITFESDADDDRPSPLGERLASALGQHGMVEHSLWFEVESGARDDEGESA